MICDIKMQLVSFGHPIQVSLRRRYGEVFLQRALFQARDGERGARPQGRHVSRELQGLCRLRHAALVRRYLRPLGYDVAQEVSGPEVQS
jgi:hypothetical protein